MVGHNAHALPTPCEQLCDATCYLRKYLRRSPREAPTLFVAVAVQVPYLRPTGFRGIAQVVKADIRRTARRKHLAERGCCQWLGGGSYVRRKLLRHVVACKELGDR